MADLDDFFAKKDKAKKGKKGPKFAKANTEILAQNLIENEKKEETAEKKDAVLLATSVVNKADEAKANPGAKEEEWKDYAEDKKDFSNLKIDTLKVESGSEQDEDEHEINEETGEKVRIKKGDTSKPWNKAAKTGIKKAPIKEKEEEQKPEPPKKEKITAASATGGYVPPHMRGGGGSSGGDSMEPQRPQRRRPGKNAPDMNTMNFPSLSDSAGIKDPSKSTPRHSEEKDFETARGGGRKVLNLQKRTIDAPDLSTDNRFAALGN